VSRGSPCYLSLQSLLLSLFEFERREKEGRFYSVMIKIFSRLVGFGTEACLRHWVTGAAEFRNRLFSYLSHTLVVDARGVTLDFKIPGVTLLWVIFLSI
jgi:hypothetical protein